MVLCLGENTKGVPLAAHGIPDGETISAALAAAKAAQAEAIAAEGPDGPEGMQGVWSPTARRADLGTATVDLLWFLGKVDHEAEQEDLKKQNYLDFWKKYHLDGPHKDEEPEIDLGRPYYAWAMIFKLPPADEVKYATTTDGDADENDDGEKDNAQFAEGNPQFMCAEAVELVCRLWQIDLSVAMNVSGDGTEVHISVGATYEILCDEANFHKPNMRLVSYKGQVPFASEYSSNYMPSLFDEPDKAHCFTSALQQQLVMKRMERRAGIHLDERLNFVERGKGMELMQHALTNGRTVRAVQVRELLATHGAFRPGAEKVFGPELVMLGRQIVADPYFACQPSHHLSKRELAMLHAEEKHMAARGLAVIQYEEIQAAADVLQEWTSKMPGIQEEFTGALQTYFPLHHDAELEYLKRNWGSWWLILRLKPWTIGKSPEGKTTLNYFNCDPTEKHLALFWTPTDTIRDYFGDHIGIYSEWLGTYTRSLVWPALLGVMIQVYQSSQEGITVDNNWLMIPYSIFLCLWSAKFNVDWMRRESELKFVWGSDDVDESAEVRTEFKGMLSVDDVTGAEEMVYYSSAARATRLILSTLVSLVCVMIVVVSAFTATTVRYIGAPHPDQVYCQEYLAGTYGNNSMAMLADHNVSSLANGTLIRETELINNVYVTRTVEGVEILRNFSSFAATVKVMGIDNKEDCRDWATGNTTDVDSIIDGVMVTHHVDDQMVIQTTWIDGWGAGTSDFDKKKYEYLSAALNTIFIVLFGMLYETIAVAMTDWENHRTQIEYDNQLILKNFGFQFVNNYFVLFYIGYMRQLDTSGLCSFFALDPIYCPDVAITECKGGTCLGQVQTNVIAVFTIKTVIAQVKEIAMPYVKVVSSKGKKFLGVSKVQHAIHEAGGKAASMAMPHNVAEMMM